MRKVWLIAWNSFVRTARDRKALALMLLMPMILIAILGAALKGMMADGKINPIPIAVVNADTPAKPQLPPGAPPQAAAALPTYDFGKILAEDVLGSDQIKQVLKVTVMTDFEQARNLVQNNKLVAVVHVPAGFTADVLAGKKANVDIFSDPGKPDSSKIVVQIVGSFTESVTAGMLAGKRLPPDEVAKVVGAAVPKVTSAPSGVKDVSAMQYYAAALAIMFMVMTAFARAREIMNERRLGTQNRLLVSPTPASIILAGQILGTMLQIITQFLILVLGTHFVYGVYWGPWPEALLLGLAFSLATAGMSTALAGLMDDPKAADAASGIVGNLFAALSGAMGPLYFFPPFMKTLAKFIPNYWGLQGYLDLMSGAGRDLFWMPVTVLTTLGLVAGALGTWRLAVRAAR